MINNSYFKRSSISGVNSLYLSLAPVHVRCSKYSSCEVNSLGTVKCGNKISLFRSRTSILSTISFVLSNASPRSSNTVCISSVFLKKNWLLGNAKRLFFVETSSSVNSLDAGVACFSPVLMHNKISCALKSFSST